jgi:hypothetical protein
MWKFRGGGGVETGALVTSATLWPLVPAPDDIAWISRWNENRQGKPKYSAENLPPSVTLSIMTLPGFEHRSPRWEAGLRYVTAWSECWFFSKVLPAKEYYIFKESSCNPARGRILVAILRNYRWSAPFWTWGRAVLWWKCANCCTN